MDTSPIRISPLNANIATQVKVIDTNTSLGNNSYTTGEYQDWRIKSIGQNGGYLKDGYQPWLAFNTVLGFSGGNSGFSGKGWEPYSKGAVTNILELEFLSWNARITKYILGQGYNYNGSVTYYATAWQLLGKRASTGEWITLHSISGVTSSNVCKLVTYNVTSNSKVRVSAIRLRITNSVNNPTISQLEIYGVRYSK